MRNSVILRPQFSLLYLLNALYEISTSSTGHGISRNFFDNFDRKRYYDNAVSNSKINRDKSQVHIYQVLQGYANFYGENLNDVLMDTELMSSGMARLEIFFDDFNVNIVEEKIADQNSSLFADIGGQFGLWLGISTLSLIEILFFGCNIFCLNLKAKCKGGSEEEQEKTEEVSGCEVGENETGWKHDYDENADVEYRKNSVFYRVVLQDVTKMAENDLQ